ncbi:MAG: hypothetical protein PUD59_00335 [bacterium]|nr:hypothetical protein [bacterium]
MKKIRNLYVSEVYGKDQSYVITKMGIKAFITDFCRYTCGSGRLKSENYFLDGCDEKYNDLENDSFGVRPVFCYSDIKKFAKNSKINNKGILEVEIGNFPDEEVIGIKGIAINYAFVNKSSVIKLLDDFKIDFKTNTIFDDNNPYVCYKKFQFKEQQYLACFNKKENRYHYFEYNPLILIVDEKNDIAICKNVIIGGIPYKTVSFNDLNNSETIISNYLNDSFIIELDSKLSKEYHGNKVLTK